MPVQTPQKTLKSRNIRRGHSGCRACRKRGKKCDETKPSCRACIRLSLECIYGIEFSFRNSGGDSFQLPAPTHAPSQAVTCQSPGKPRHGVSSARMPICSPLDSGESMENRYLSHFMTHVRPLLPANPSQFTEKTLQSPCLKSAVLCISASNLSMLNTQVQSRALPNDPRRSVFSPLVNPLHHSQAQKYHNRALSYCHSTSLLDIETDAPVVLGAYTLLAYYHHASTDHAQFRLAVWDTVRFVATNRDSLARSKEGSQALQMWYRLCVSHRLGKPPALLLEGEGGSSFGPNRYPDSFEQLYLDCIMGMSTDDLIYDILIKTMELRSRLVVFRCVAGSCGSSEMSKGIGSTAHDIFNALLGREDTEDERAEAENAFVRGAHLGALLDIQRERLKVWKSRLGDDQKPDSSLPFATHRVAMNALYAILCEMMFDEACDTMNQTPPLHNHADSIIQIINTLDFTTSSTADIYTLSLSEVLLQLVLVYKSDAFFHFILDTVWPTLENKARGYEHSHYPTHLVKRMIAQLAQYWAAGRDVAFALPAVPEDVGKLKLLDIDHPVDLAVCGWNPNGGYFVEKGCLP
ncbi:hypothetical protein BJX76DRAFT_347364 [Aspergillus varians]